MSRPAYKPSATVAYVMLAATTLFWSGNWITGRALHDELTPVTLNIYRWIITSVVILPFAGPAAWRQRRLIRQHWALIAGLALLSSALFQTGVYLGLSMTQAVNGVLLNSTLPAFMILTSWLVARERVTRRQLLGVAISFCGVLTIMSRGNPATLIALGFNWGDLVLVAIMPLWSFYSNLLKRVPAELGAMALFQTMSLFTVVMLAPFFAWDLLAGRVQPLTVEVSLALLYVAIPATALAYPMWNVAVAAVGPNRASFFIHLMPVYGTILAVMILGEAFHLFHLAGIALIFVGIYLSTIAGRRPPTRAP